MATRREIFEEALRQLRQGNEPYFGGKPSLVDAAQKTFRMRLFCHDPLELLFATNASPLPDPPWLLKALSRQRRAEISNYKKGRLP